MNNKIEALVVAFSYLDLLSITLPRNLEILDNIIILTKPGDSVIDYCKSLNSNKLTVIPTNIMHHHGCIFDKGATINLGIKYLAYNDWFMTLDGDVCLPKDFRENFFALPPDINYCYGSRRYQFNTRKEWDDFNDGIKPLNEIAIYRGYGYGFCSMFNYNSETFQRLLKERGDFPYPCNPRAAEIDWQMVRNWEDATMVYNDPPNESPNLFLENNNDTTLGLLRESPRVYHLGMPGLNHEGRATEIFK